MYCFRPALHQEGAAWTEGGCQLSWDESTRAETAGGWRELNFVETADPVEQGMEVQRYTRFMW